MSPSNTSSSIEQTHTATSQSKTVDLSLALYHPVELAYLADWFGVDRPAPARDIDLDDWQGVECDEFVCLRDGPHWVYGPVENAVARLCLDPIQESLPQWATFKSDGELNFGRHYDESIPRRIQWHPELLLKINWADSGPGISWPEAWHVTLLPYFNRCVVTAAVDSTDDWGWTEVALGHFDATENHADAATNIIERYWRKDYGYRDEPFECVLAEGLITGHTAWRLARSIWPMGDGA